MTGHNYYVLTALPTLGEFGNTAPLTPGQLLEFVSDNPVPRAILETVFLSDDLLRWQSSLAGESSQSDPVVLTESQVCQNEPLPSYLVADTQTEAPGIPGDEVWASYFRYATSEAGRLKSRFLSLWTEYEVTLRNAIAIARARALNLDPDPYLVAGELAICDEDFTGLINEWTRSENPFIGLRILDKARWDWLIQHEGWFTFDNDELAAYGAKLMLLCRWQRLEKTRKSSVSQTNTDTNHKSERVNA